MSDENTAEKKTKPAAQTMLFGSQSAAAAEAVRAAVAAARAATMTPAPPSPQAIVPQPTASHAPSPAPAPPAFAGVYIRGGSAARMRAGTPHAPTPAIPPSASGPVIIGQQQAPAQPTYQQPAPPAYAPPPAAPLPSQPSPPQQSLQAFHRPPQTSNLDERHAQPAAAQPASGQPHDAGRAQVDRPAVRAELRAPARGPVDGCRHAYPIVERTPGFLPAFKLAMKTSPFAFYRFLQWSLLSGISLALLLIAVGAGMALLLWVNRWLGVGVLVGGILAWALVWVPFMNRKSFGALCAHIALLTELITKGQIGNGQQTMFEFSKELIAERVGDMATIGGLYRTINSALRKLGRVMRFADGVLNLDMAWVRRLLDRVVAWVSPYITAVVLSYGLARGDSNFNEAGQDGLCYGAQNGKAMMKTAVGAVLLETLLTAPLWLAIFAGSAFAVFRKAYVLMGGNLEALYANLKTVPRSTPLPFLVATGGALLLGYLLASLVVKPVRESFVKPALLTMMMLKFHVTIEDQPLDPKWRDRIGGAGAALGGLDRLRRGVVRSAGI